MTMKMLFGLALTSFVLAGCHPDVPEAAVKATATRVEPPAAQPSAPTEQKASAPRAGDNPKRIYQLADLKKGSVKVDGKPISVWLMNDTGKREEGMMWLTDKDVKADEGMLFVFESAQPLSFWMQNTVLPLDIMYVSANGRILNIAKGKPFDETSLPSAGDAQFVIEMKQGSAKRLGFHPGSNVEISDAMKKAE